MMVDFYKKFDIVGYKHILCLIIRLPYMNKGLLMVKYFGYFQDFRQWLRHSLVILLVIAFAGSFGTGYAASPEHKESQKTDGTPGPVPGPSPDPFPLLTREPIEGRDYYNQSLAAPVVSGYGYVHAFGQDRLNYFYFKTPQELMIFIHGAEQLLSTDSLASGKNILHRQQALEIANRLLVEFDRTEAAGYIPAPAQKISRDLLDYSRKRLLISISGR